MEKDKPLLLKFHESPNFRKEEKKRKRSRFILRYSFLRDTKNHIRFFISVMNILAKSAVASASTTELYHCTGSVLLGWKAVHT